MSIVFKDEFHGVGGVYVVDPKSGKRDQVQPPTAHAPSAPDKPEEPAPAAKPRSTKE